MRREREGIGTSPAVQAVEKHIKPLIVEDIQIFVFQCPVCRKKILANTYFEAIKNGKRHTAKCQKMIEKVSR